LEGRGGVNFEEGRAELKSEKLADSGKKNSWQIFLGKFWQIFHKNFHPFL
jgi:hypothetical protein